MVRAAQAAGRRSGRTTPRDLREKADALPGVEWHFIGALQTNKAKHRARGAGPHLRRLALARAVEAREGCLLTQRLTR
jgi:uncharacterized pyridoxal phosphate-containing UPF0001 family protein